MRTMEQAQLYAQARTCAYRVPPFSAKTLLFLAIVSFPFSSVLSVALAQSTEAASSTTLAAVPKKNYTTNDCFQQFLRLNLNWTDYDRYEGGDRPLLRNHTVLTAAPLGQFVGPDAIREFMQFWNGPVTPYFTKAALIMQFSDANRIQMNGTTCMIPSHALYDYATDPANTLAEAKFQVATMSRIYLQLEPEDGGKPYVMGMDLYYSPNFLEFFFDTILHNAVTHTYVCSVMRRCSNQSEDIGTNANSSACMSKLDSLPVSIKRKYDGFYSSCYAFHTPYVAALLADNTVADSDNDDRSEILKSHCAHLSFIPTSDMNGETKCQSSSIGLNESALWNADELKALAMYIQRSGVAMVPDMGYHIDSLLTAPPTPSTTEAPKKPKKTSPPTAAQAALLCATGTTTKVPGGGGDMTAMTATTNPANVWPLADYHKKEASSASASIGLSWLLLTIFMTVITVATA